MPKRQDLTGKRFGRLVATGVSHRTHNGIYWNCQCDCGNTHKVIVNHLNDGHVNSCGCLNRDVAVKTMTKHGMYQTPEYRAWIGMKGRCENPNNTAFKNYGGRGIKICDRWHSFEAFFADMGTKPFPKASLERIDRNGNYTPENCKWASSNEQNNNTRRNVRITFDGVTQTLFQWLRAYNVKPQTYYERLKSGWTREDAIKKPVRKMRRHHHHQDSTDS